MSLPNWDYELSKDHLKLEQALKSYLKTNINDINPIIFKNDIINIIKTMDTQSFEDEGSQDYDPDSEYIEILRLLLDLQEKERLEPEFKLKLFEKLLEFIILKKFMISKSFLNEILFYADILNSIKRELIKRDED